MSLKNCVFDFFSNSEYSSIGINSNYNICSTGDNSSFQFGFNNISTSDVFNCGLGVNIPKNNQEVSVSPNPFYESLSISSNTVIFSITIYDLMGKLIFYKDKIMSTSDLINTFDIQSGVYFIKIKNNDGTFLSKKLVKL